MSPTPMSRMARINPVTHQINLQSLEDAQVEYTLQKCRHFLVELDHSRKIRFWALFLPFFWTAFWIASLSLYQQELGSRGARNEESGEDEEEEKQADRL